jgi:HK97 family phage portal protein
VQGKVEQLFNKYIWNVSKKDVGPTFDLKGTTSHANIFGYNDNFSEEPVSERRAHGLATVFTCLNVRMRTMGALPINPMIEENGQKKVITDHAVYYPLAQQANNYMSSAQLFMSSQLLADSWGNSVVFIHRDSRMRPYAFDLLAPDEWNVTKKDGEAWYKINGEVYPSRDVLHFRWFSLDGLNGISPIRQNQITMGGAFKQERYYQMSLGQSPPGFLKYEGQINETQQKQNQKSWKEDRRAGLTPILGGNWDYKYTMLPPHEVEYVQTAGLSDQKICGIYQMPPTFVQDYNRATWSNAENADLVYAKHTITPICRVIEQECNMKLFTEKEKKNHFVKFNLNGLLRGDIAARAAFYKAMRDIGGLNGNEIRSYEDLNSYEGGDIYTVQSANIPVDQLRKFYENKVAPTATPGGPINGKTVNGFHHEFN